MFDNSNDQNRNIPANGTKNSPAPPNIPLIGASHPAEDIFLETTNRSQVLPSTNVPLPTSPLIPNDEYASNGRQGRNKLLLLISILIGVVAVGYGAYFVFGRIVNNLNRLKENSDTISATEPAKNNEPVPETAQKTAENPVAAPAAMGISKEDSATTSPPSSIEPTVSGGGLDGINTVATSVPDQLEPVATSTAAIDTDKDGLTDVEEKMLGTSPINIDSDNDGLTDFEEVRIYRSDPLKSDTDGDGFNDGEEVKAGYNPLGEGKLKLR